MIQSQIVRTEPSPLDPGLSAPLPQTNLAVRLAALVEVVLTSGFPTQLAIGVLLAAAGWHPYGVTGAISMRHIAGLLLIDTIVLTGLIALALRARGERPLEVLLGTRPRWREIGLGAALVPVVFGGTTVVLVLIRWWWPNLHNVSTNPFEALIRTPADAIFMAAVAIIGGGFKEELQRAFILHRFDQHLGGARIGLVVYSLLFGAGHLVQGWDVGVITTLLGLAWGMVFLWRRCALAPMVSHAGFNAAQVLQFFIVGS
jgi:membrane protease YdiL (CAAX protease family)